jgi:hypothetical protein
VFCGIQDNIFPLEFFHSEKCKLNIWMYYIHFQPLRCEMKKSTSSVFHTVMRSLNLKGFGNLPSLTQRQIVAGLTGIRPVLSFEFANSEMRITLFDMFIPSTTLF